MCSVIEYVSRVVNYKFIMTEPEDTSLVFTKFKQMLSSSACIWRVVFGDTVAGTLKLLSKRKNLLSDFEMCKLYNNRPIFVRLEGSNPVGSLDICWLEGHVEHRAAMLNY